MLQILNAKRVSKGLAPFKNYSDYIAPVKTEFITQANNKSDPVTPLNKLGDESLDFGGQPLKANGNVYHIISGGYYVAWNKSRCYIQKQETSEVDILVHGDTLYGESALMSMIPNKSFRDLTRMEVDSIVSGKPSYKSLFMAYSKLRNFQNVTIDTLNALPIW